MNTINYRTTHAHSRARAHTHMQRVGANGKAHSHFAKGTQEEATYVMYNMYHSHLNRVGNMCYWDFEWGGALGAAPCPCRLREALRAAERCEGEIGVLTSPISPLRGLSELSELSELVAVGQRCHNRTYIFISRSLRWIYAHRLGGWRLRF